MAAATQTAIVSPSEIPSAHLAPDNIFRAYDIRGIADTELNCTNIREIGRAIGTLALENGLDTLLIGADGRLSSPRLSQALKKGILSTGCNLRDLGIIPTPLLYFATHVTEWSSGVMLTASHNPAEYNGIKLVHERTCLTAAQIQKLRAHIAKGKFAQGKGTLTSMDLRDVYIDRIRSDITLARRLNVVIDCGNAVPAVVAPQLFEALGCEVTSLYCEVDGRFPNHHPDPTVAENLEPLIARVLADGADLGVAFDGDGDRVIIVTNKGHVIDTDRLLMLFIRDILPRYTDTPRVVFDVKSSDLLAGMVRDLGGEPVLSRSGHSFMKHAMQQHQAVVGAEFSAHVFIKDRWFGYDDGLYVAARFLEILAAGDRSCEDLLRSLPPSIVTPELRIDVGDERKFELMDVICEMAVFPDATVDCLDGVRASFPDGWGLIRASNTTPALLLRFEASSTAALARIQQRFRELIKRVDPSLPVAF
jgi:phosphomannomutase / phosphoglucomutase